MNSIPEYRDNPEGFHLRYLIYKIVPVDDPRRIVTGRVEPTDPKAEYFVLRLDDGGSDPEHLKACRIAIHAYADAIEHHLPKLAKDLRERYLMMENIKPSADVIIISNSVFSREECVFHYCPHPEHCQDACVNKHES